MQRMISLEGARNVRDLGGLLGQSGQPLRQHRFVRADSLESLHAMDVIRLLEYGITIDIDLRSKHERQQWGDALSNIAEVDYVPVPLLDGLEQHLASLPASLGELYVAALQHCQHGFRDIFQTMVAQPDAGILFHCSAGKDRTGMIAALLLDLAGVSHSQIVLDYAQSASNLTGLLDKLAEQNASELKHLLGSEPEHMALFLSELSQQHGGAAGYLRHIGLDQAAVATLRSSMFEAA